MIWQLNSSPQSEKPVPSVTAALAVPLGVAPGRAGPRLPRRRSSHRLPCGGCRARCAVQGVMAQPPLPIADIPGQGLTAGPL